MFDRLKKRSFRLDKLTSQIFQGHF